MLDFNFSLPKVQNQNDLHHPHLDLSRLLKWERDGKPKDGVSFGICHSKQTCMSDLFVVRVALGC